MIVFKWLGIGLAAFAIALAMLFVGARFADGPIEIVPGGPFSSGEWVEAPIDDWGFVSDLETIQVQLEGTSTSRTVWVAAHDGQAYIPASLNFPPGKTWHLDAARDGRAILRIDGQRYRVNLRKLRPGGHLARRCGPAREIRAAAGWRRRCVDLRVEFESIVNIRRLRPADAEAFCRLRAAGLHESPDAFGASPDEDVSADLNKAQALLQPDLEDAVLGAFDISSPSASSSASSTRADQLIGVVGLHRATHAKARHHATVWGMYVAPEARQKGAAAALLESLIAHARTLAGLDWLQLGVGRDNRAACAVYEKSGFRGWGMERDALRVAGEPVDEVHMALSLGASATARETSAAARQLAGHCLCNGVRFEVRQVVGPLELCHCTRCRRVSGSAFVAGLMVATAGYRMTQGRELVRSFSLPLIEVPPAYTSFFCSRCGSPVPNPEPKGDRFEIPAGLLNADPGITADRNIFTEHRAPWFETGGGLPELDRAAVIRLRLGEAKRPVGDEG